MRFGWGADSVRFVPQSQEDLVELQEFLGNLIPARLDDHSMKCAEAFLATDDWYEEEGEEQE